MGQNSSLPLEGHGGDRSEILPLVTEVPRNPKKNRWGRNPLSDTPYQNQGMVLNGQGPGWHPHGDTPCHDLGMLSSEQGSGHRFLSGALHRRSGVVKNEQGSSHLSRRMRRVRKLV